MVCFGVLVIRILGAIDMRYILVALLIFLSAFRLESARADMSAPSEVAVKPLPPDNAIVKSALEALIRDLQAKAVRQKQGDKTVDFSEGPIDPQLASLGVIKNVFLSDPIEAKGLFNFTAGVTHQSGESRWTLSTTDDGRIVAYTFITKPADLHAWNSNTFFMWPPRGAAEIFAQTYSHVDTAMETQSPPKVDPRTVEFLFATTRKAAPGSPVDKVEYTGDRAPLTFGAVSVRIPEDHKTGHIELPSSWKLFGFSLYTETPNEDKHFIIKNVVQLTGDEFSAGVREKGAKSALVFVHGFNNSFDDSVYRAAQVFWDLQYHGLPILFTWASRGDTLDYGYDKESANLARDSFIDLIKDLHALGIEQIYVIAHSMGNLIAVDALANYAQTSDPVQIARLVMAAPDVDRNVFEQSAPKAKTIVGGMTLYASSADLAMKVSRGLAGGIPRAGDVPDEGPIVLPNIETIDVTNVGDDVLGMNHDTFAASRDVMEDIAALLSNKAPPPRPAQIRQVPDPPAAVRYWQFAR